MSTALPYLGPAGALLPLPSPDQGFDNPESRGDKTFDLLSGAVGVRRRLNPKQSWALQFTGLAPSEESLLRSFYLGVYGPGPHVYVDPSAVNVLSVDVSSCGARSQASHGWVGSGGTVTVDATQVTPQAGSAVLKWASPGASKTLQPGTVAGTADITKAPVIVPTENTTGSLWCKASGTGAQYRLDYFDVTGAYISSSGTTAIGTSWARFSRNLLAGLAPAGAVFVLPTVFTSGSPANVWISGGQVEYGVTSVSAWQLGFGSPRVRITGPLGRNVPLYGQSTHTLTLAEV